MQLIPNTAAALPLCLGLGCGLGVHGKVFRDMTDQSVLQLGAALAAGALIGATLSFAAGRAATQRRSEAEEGGDGSLAALSGATALLPNPARPPRGTAPSRCLVRQAAPAFSADAVVRGACTRVGLSDYRGQYVVLLFYTADFTFVCPTELCEFNDAAPAFRRLGCAVLACSCDSVHSHRAWSALDRSSGGLGLLDLPLLADFDKSIASSYGALISDPGDPQVGMPFRALFVIDAGGKVRHAQVGDTQVGRSVAEVIRIVQAFQYVDKHGKEHRVCPVDWRPGDPTIVAKDRPLPAATGVPTAAGTAGIEPPAASEQREQREQRRRRQVERLRRRGAVDEASSAADGDPDSPESIAAGWA